MSPFEKRLLEIENGCAEISAALPELIDMVRELLAQEARADHVMELGSRLIETLHARLTAITAVETPWPLPDVLVRLLGASEHLLEDHGCDAHGHEDLAAVQEAARKILAVLAEPGDAPS